MKSGQAITSCMGKYATFSGRASRSEFWWFYLFTVGVSWGSLLVGGAMFSTEPELAEIPSYIVSLVFLLPVLAAGCRRLHDIGRSGWWQLLILTGIGVILLVIWWAQSSKQEAYKYGPLSAQPPT